MSKQRAKGTTFESAIVKYIDETSAYIVAERLPLAGAADKGDIRLRDRHGQNVPFVIEAKNCVKLELAGWMDELEAEMANAQVSFGAVIHKRVRHGDMAKQYVTMDLKSLVFLLDLWVSYE